jgi:hypothetical protein
VTLPGVTVSDDPALDNFTCSPSNPADLAPGDKITCTGTHAITQADLDTGTFKDNACAVSGTTKSCAPDTITGNPKPALTTTKTDDLNPNKYDHVGQVITYTITATNTGNVPQSITVSDTPALTGFSCTPANGSSIAPGGTITCTGTHSVTQADLNAGTFGDNACADATGATEACAPDTVTGDQTRTLSITKSDDLNPAHYDHVGQVITYTITATNTGNVPQSITVSDTPALTGFSCTPANGSSIAPGGTITCTGTHSVTQADLNAGTFGDNACADATGATEACAPDTVIGAPPTIVSQITPTQTTCSQFAGGTSPTLSTINYSVSKGKVQQNVNPGVMFYWVKVPAVAGSNTFTITQTQSTTSNAFTVASGSQAYTSACGALSTNITQATNGTVTVTFTAASAGTYYIGIKYNPKAVAGEAAPSPSTVVYTFATTGVANSTSTVNLVKQ